MACRFGRGREQVRIDAAGGGPVDHRAQDPRRVVRRGPRLDAGQIADVPVRREKADDQSENGERHRQDQTQRAENEWCSNLKRQVRPRLQGEARFREFVARSLQAAGNDATDARLQARARIRLPRREREDQRAHRDALPRTRLSAPCRTLPRFEAREQPRRGLPGLRGGSRSGRCQRPSRASKSSVSAYSPSRLTPSSAASWRTIRSPERCRRRTTTTSKTRAM